MSYKIVLFMLVLTGCSTFYTPEVWNSECDDLITLQLFTGKYGSNLYSGQFEEKAKEVCPKGYEVIKKTYKPDSLNKNIHSEYYYNWVIRCR